MTEAKLPNPTADLIGRDFAGFIEDIPSRSDINAWLERQNLSADAKALLAKLSEVTSSVGATVLPIGKKILSTLMSMVKTFPNATIGLVIGAVLAFLVGSIPLIGWLIAPFLSPVLLALGIGMGAVADFQAMQLRSQMEIIAAQYSAVKP